MSGGGGTTSGGGWGGWPGSDGCAGVSGGGTVGLAGGGVAILVSLPTQRPPARGGCAHKKREAEASLFLFPTEAAYASL